MLVVAIVGAVLGSAFAASVHVPEVDSISDFAPGLVTNVLDSTGDVYQRYFLENRALAEEGEIPQVLQDALLASEDRNFFRHGGVDPIGVARAALANLISGSKTQGASTLTMQLAGLLYLDRSDRTWRRKIPEAFRAVALEKTLSKQQILTLYCNLVPLGHRNYGFKAAARFFFDKSLAELTIAEAAALVAIVKRPADRSPIRNPEVVVSRRNIVLRLIHQQGMIDDEQFAAAVAEPLVVATPAALSSGQYFAEEVRRYLYKQYGEAGLYERGLEVRTTLDMRVQRAAEEAVLSGLTNLDRGKGWRGAVRRLGEDELAPLITMADGSVSPSRELPPAGKWLDAIVESVDRRGANLLIGAQRSRLEPEGVAWTKRPLVTVLGRGDQIKVQTVAKDDGTVALELVQEPELEAAVVVLESATGAVRALVGGWDYHRSEFNRATQARRQPGSAFKPFVFGAAFEAGFTPADTVYDAPAVFAGAENLPTYSPRNFYRRYEGIITLRRALEKSINVSSVKLLDLVGVDRVIDFARRAGIASELPPFPSLALGSAEVSVIELAAAYASIANQGMWIEPYLIDTVANSAGRRLETHQLRATKAMEPEVAYLLEHTLEGVVDRGTGAEARSLQVAIGGKTGTTDGYTDAWFAGFTPKYTIVTWVGYDLKRSIGRDMTGARAALPIWIHIVKRGLEESWITPGERFLPPPGIVFRTIESWSGQLANPETIDTVEEAFITGTEPVKFFDRRLLAVRDLPWYQQRAFYGKPKDGENMPEDIVDWSLVVRDE